MSKRKVSEMTEVLRQEEGRGGRPVPSEEDREAYARRKKEWKDILQAMTWEEVVIALSLREDKKEYAEMHQTWLRYRRGSDSRESS